MDRLRPGISSNRRLSSSEIQHKRFNPHLPCGRTEHPEPYIRNARTRHDILSLPFTEEASILLSDLPRHHKDPFDRMLICYALLHGMTFVTSDPKNHFYSVPRI